MESAGQDFCVFVLESVNFASKAASALHVSYILKVDVTL